MFYTSPLLQLEQSCTLIFCTVLDLSSINISTSFATQNIPSLKLTWPLKMGHPKRKLVFIVFQPSIFGCFVSSREGNHRRFETLPCTTCPQIFPGGGLQQAGRRRPAPCTAAGATCLVGRSLEKCHCRSRGQWSIHRSQRSCSSTFMVIMVMGNGWVVDCGFHGGLDGLFCFFLQMKFVEGIIKLVNI